MNPVKHIPNFITLMNLLSGSLAIVAIALGDPLLAAKLVVLAAILDFFDGFAARMLKVSSPIGAQLDSLADMVTFGVVPGLMLLHYLSGPLVLWDGLTPVAERPELILPFAVPLFSALRLAKFNVDTRQSDSFRGLPTPASATWIISIPLVAAYRPDVVPETVALTMQGPVFIIGSAIVLSLLMVMDMPLLAMKFKHFGWQGNAVRYTFLIISAVLLIILRPAALPLILSLYLLLSIIENQRSKTR